MQVHPWFIGLAVAVAAAGFYLALMVPLASQAPLRGMQPPQFAAQR
jgi:hypothetical protein